MNQEHITPDNKDTSTPKHLFKDDTVKALSELGDVLRDIRKRLIREGILIKDGDTYRKK